MDRALLMSAQPLIGVIHTGVGMANHGHDRHFSRFLRATALAVSLILPVGLVSQPAAEATPAEQLPACADPSVPEDVNHASIRLEGPTNGTEVAVDEHGKIALSGFLHKNATMVDVSVGRLTTTDITLGPPPAGVSDWSASWTASLRPAELGENEVCARAEREPGRYARILRSVTVVDLLPPSAVPDLTVGAITATTAKATWGEATDNYGLAGYEITVDGGTPHRTTIGTRSYSITGLSPSTNHTVSVVAVDLAGNKSATRATASFTTAAAPPPPDPDADLVLDPEQGAATATWHPDPATETSYRAYLDGQLYDEFSLTHFCQDADGNPANPCTAGNSIVLPIGPLEEYTPYTFRVEALRADRTVARELSADFTTMINTDEVSPAATQQAASEGSQCAGSGGDFYLAADSRTSVTVPAGSTELFPGCYTVSNDSCLDAFLPPSGEKLVNCADSLTQLLFSAAPPGRGPVISSVDPVPGRVSTLFDPGNATMPITWCAQNTTTCTLVLAPAAQAVRLVAVAPAAAVGTSWVVVALSGIGIGLALWALLEILFPGQIGIHGILEYPIRHDTDFDTFENWGADEGEWYNSLKIYAEVIKTTKLVADRDGIPFAWTNAEDGRLKRIIDAACTAQRGTQGTAGCDNGFAVYVPGGVSYDLRPMKETGTHIVTAMGDGGYPQPPTRAQWFYPARSQGGRAAIDAGYPRRWFNTHFTPNECTGRAPGTVCDEFPFWVTNQAVNLSGERASLKPVPPSESSPQGTEMSAFFRKCEVADGERFIVLPVKPWVAANGPSFGFRVSEGGASMCMSPKPAAAP